jgi:hypothetical protein
LDPDWVPTISLARYFTRAARRDAHTAGSARLYKLAAGQNTTHQPLADALRGAFGWDIAFLPHAPLAEFRPISVGRLNAEFGLALTDSLESLSTLHAIAVEFALMLINDEAANRITLQRPDDSQQHTLDTPEAFEAVSAAWSRWGWDVTHVYSFFWMGRPMIQLPEDMVRIQEVIWRILRRSVCRHG